MKKFLTFMLYFAAFVVGGCSIIGGGFCLFKMKTNKEFEAFVESLVEEEIEALFNWEIDRKDNENTYDIID